MKVIHNLDEWQEEALAWEGHLLLCTGRQIGKTFILGRKSGKKLAENKNFRILCISRSEDQAQLIIRMALEYLEENCKDLIDYHPQRRPTKTSINLKNGSWMMARPVGFSGDAVRGFTGEVLIMDEAAFFDDEVFTSAKPVLLSTGGKMWIASTPKGKQGKFWEYFQNKNGRFKVIHASSEEVIYNRKISESWTEAQRAESIKYLEEEKMEMSQTQYGQEYLGLFMDDVARFFEADLINKALVLKPFQAMGKKYLGVDIARLGKDEGAYEGIVNVHKDFWQHYLHDKTMKLRITETANKVRGMHKAEKYRKIGLDTGGVGGGVFDILLTFSDTANVIVDLDNSKLALDRDDKRSIRLTKEHMYSIFKAALERGALQLIDHPDIRASLESVQYEYVKEAGQLTRLRIWASYNHPIEALVRAFIVAFKDQSTRPFVTHSGSSKVF